MSTSGKSIFSFLAGAAAVVAANAYFKSERGKKTTRNLASQLKGISKRTRENINHDWLNDLGDSALHSAKNFKDKIKS